MSLTAWRNGFIPGRSGGREVRIPQNGKVRFHGTNVEPPSFSVSLSLYGVSSIVRLMLGHNSWLQVQPQLS